jgi:hypothetical protein
VAVFLERCATAKCLRILAVDYRISEGTVCNVLGEVGAAMVRAFDDAIRLPTREESLQNVRDFEDMYGTPLIAGAMDGTVLDWLVELGSLAIVDQLCLCLLR